MNNDFSETRSERRKLVDVLPLDTPYTVHIDPSGACNFSCGFCPCNTVNFRNSDRHKIMTMELFCKIADDLTCFPQKIRVINLYDFGESLLNKNVPEMVKILREKDVCEEIIMATNGSLLTPELNTRLASCGIDFIKISVEALSTEGYKNVSNVDLDFEVFLDNIKDLKRKCHENVCLKNGGRTKIHAKCVNAVLKSDADIEKFYELFDGISDYASVENVEDWWSGFEPMINQDSVRVISNINHGGKICTRPFIHMIIHSNGEISACCNDWKFATVYGNASEERLVDVWGGKRLRNFQLMHLEGRRSENDFCAECSFFCNDNIDDDAEVIAEKLRKPEKGDKKKHE